MVRTIPKRSEIPEDHKWNLSRLFSSHDQWQTEFTQLEQKINDYDQFKGFLHKSADILADAIEFDLEISRRIDRLYTYAHLKSDQDKSNSFYLGLLDRVVNLSNRAGELSSFLTPEIIAVPDEAMAKFITRKRLIPYKFYLQKKLRLKPHILEPSIERILAMSQELARTPSQVFGQLDNVDLNFGTMKDNEGNEIELSHGNFITFLMNPDREIRKKAFLKYYQVYDHHKHTISATLSNSVKKDYFYARVRNYENCRRAALFKDNIPDSVYDNLVETVNHHLPVLFKYLKYRKKTLGAEQLHFYDTYVPLVSEINFKMSYEAAVETAKRALSPLGSQYTQIMSEGLLNGWVDRYENKGKRSGAYSSGCYDSPPFILLNYEDKNLNSLYTLIHEAGHSMHSYFSDRHQPYVYHNYTIFVAEVASTFNEVLLSHYLLEKNKNDPKMTAYILNREIDSIRGTLFRQTMFAEFEKIIHEMTEKNEPLTINTITGEYRKLIDCYFGETLTVDDELCLECLRIPHFYSAFYVYQYATGISAAIALARNVLSGDETARDAYLHFLTLGGSQFPLDELIAAGVDLRTSEPVKSALKYFEKLVDKLIESG
jgi:oligoendopeptidase F